MHVDGGSPSARAMPGDPGNDRLLAGEGNNVLIGDDILVGGAGNDNLQGHHGNDVLIGGAGNDQAYGGYGNDLLVDTLYDPLGNNTAQGTGANDRITGNF